MNNETFFDMIFKRKSFHKFDEIGTVSEDELERIEGFLNNVTPLYPDIKVRTKIVKESETTCKRGAEYCVLFYSEKKENYLHNIGYIGEQLDLFLTSLDIGTLWFGIGRPNEKAYDDLSYAIMIAFAKKPNGPFRRDMYAAKRKTLDEIWKGKTYDFSNIVRFTPSACNSQPWFIEGDDKGLTIFRCRKPGKVGIMPIAMVPYYNKIDMGIFFFILEVCLTHFGYKFDRELFVDGEDAKLKTLNAKYMIR